ncbi:MAG: STAS domain-containing protein [Microcoleaceae cyanobacterium MO_207.B10]|nr:STAS domain-containing protein [Microcoleaceae cyanobacterium MO_207.B10]
MVKGQEVPRIPLQISQGCLIASIQIDLTEEILHQFRQDLLNRLHQTGVKGLIIDLSGVEVMDIEDFEAINTTLSMASIMGAKTILTGFQPGVVSSLVDLNVDFEQIQATLNLDHAFELMQQLNSEKYADLNEAEQEKVEENSIEIEENFEDNESAKVCLDWGKSGI